MARLLVSKSLPSTSPILPLAESEPPVLGTASDACLVPERRAAARPSPPGALRAALTAALFPSGQQAVMNGPKHERS